ncbi:MAG: type 1 glutamine amidotransferase [bacterium]|nr:type 1 glutamine amidotransferase [bacterium]
MKKILLIQSRQTPEMIHIEQENFRRAVGKLAELEFLSALDERLAWTMPDEVLSGYDGAIFGGSSDFDLHGGRREKDPARIMAAIILSRTRLFITYAFAQNLPVLGICFGHQIIAQMHGGVVESDLEQKKVGSHEVNLTPDGEGDPLFNGFPKSFVAQYGHKDSVTVLPSGSLLLADGRACKFSALRYGEKAYTFQFHPEVNYSKFAARLKEFGYLPEGVKPESVVRESPVASTLISAWIERVVPASRA